MKTRPHLHGKSSAPDPYQPPVPMPPLTGEEYLGLKESIRKNGIKVPILVDQRKRIIDGSHRKKIAGELGIECPETVVDDMPEKELRALARALNMARPTTHS